MASLRCKLIFNTQQFILIIILFVDLFEFLKSIPNMAKIWRCLSVHKQIISYFFLNFKVPCLLTLYLPGFFLCLLHMCFKELLQLQFKYKIYSFSPDFLGLLGW